MSLHGPIRLKDASRPVSSVEESAMSLRILMIIKATVCVVFALPMLLYPEPLLGLFGVTFCTAAALTAREYGAALAGNAFLTWMARSADESVARRAIITALFVYDAVALIACLFLQFSGVMNVIGWGVVVIYLFFTVGFGMFLMPRKN
jgi:hypothetical protein